MDSRRILVVDDESELRSMLRSYLVNEGFDVDEASEGQEAIDRLGRSDFDLVILDIGLPDVDGFEVLRQIRLMSNTPVIMLTARSEEVDRVVGLTVGADDYVTKPFSPRELIARIRAVLRRSTMSPTPTPDRMSFEGLVIDAGAREVIVDGAPRELTALEFDLLLNLAEAQGRVFTRSQLLARVWGWDYYGVERVVDVHIANVRKALGDDAADPRFISTVRGVGYKFVGRPA